MPVRVFFTGFWSGFFERTNPNHIGFFIRLLSGVYGETVESGDFNTSDVLVENTQVSPSVRRSKQWRHTYLFSGESYIRDDMLEYDCVLRGKKTCGNIVNCPLYISYLHCNPRSFACNIEAVPKKEVLAIISNHGGRERNFFLDKLEKHMSVTYAGHYKNNTGGPIQACYNTGEFIEYVRQFKFVIAIENSRLDNDTYITEKICHGLFAGCVPVYWGSPCIKEYFNEKRVLVIDDNSSLDSMIEHMKSLNDDEWLQVVNSPVFTDHGSTFGIDTIVADIRNCLKLQV